MEKKMVVGVKGILLYKGKLLIIKRSDHAHVGAGTWECPGGKLEFGEGLEEALIREMKEEVGLDITVDKLLYATSFHTEKTRQVILLTYLCKCDDDKVILSEEHTAYQWGTVDQLKELLPKSIYYDFKENHVFEIF